MSFSELSSQKGQNLAKKGREAAAVDVKPLRSDCKVHQSALFREGSRCPCRCETCVTLGPLGSRLVPWCHCRHCRHAPGISARLYKLLKVPAYPNISDLAAVDPRRCTEFWTPEVTGNLRETSGKPDGNMETYMETYIERIQRIEPIVKPFFLISVT